jgi:hypothetical protein
MRIKSKTSRVLNLLLIPIVIKRELVKLQNKNKIGFCHKSNRATFLFQPHPHHHRVMIGIGKSQGNGRLTGYFNIG